MSRRQSGLTALLVALPWWVSVTLAAIAYVALAYGAPSLNLSNPFLQPIAKITAPLLALPAALLLLALAVASAFAAFYRRRLLDRQRDLESLRQRGLGINGYRSKYLHWCLNFLLLSGAVHSSQLFQEAQALVREVCPDFSKEIRSILSTLYRKAQAYEAGEKVEFGGREYLPLYTPRNSTLRELFDIQDAETPHLKTIITAGEAAERDRRRHRKAVDRATYLETAEQRRAQARLLSARGLT